MSRYKNLTHEQIEELLSNYLIDYWSYSRVDSFSRNEKGFEMSYVYGHKGKSSATTVAGQAYHKALDLFFNNLKVGMSTDIVELEQIAFAYIDEKPADTWKIQKTNPTVDDCIQSAIKNTSTLINNFMSEAQVYLSEIKEVVHSEVKMKSWVRVNGVDIPLPCYLVIDLVIITNDDKRVIIDHKSRSRFTDESELRFSIGKQAVTYVLGYESETGNTVDEVWFIENKLPKNKDRSPQLLCFKSIMDKSTRRLYEALLYEPLKRMITAVNDPDYVYLINDSDNFIDKAEMYEFWAKTMLAEIESFNVPENKKPLIEARLRKIRDASLGSITPTVIKNFKKYAEQFIPYDLSNKDMTNQQKIEHVLRSFGIVTEVQHTFDGYSSSSYLLAINAGTSISAISKYKLDIANALNVPNVRIQKDLLVYGGKSYLTIESGKKSTSTLFWDKTKLIGNKIPIGVDNFGQTLIWDTDNHSTPHALVCGATGSGKSVWIKSTLEYGLQGVFGKVVIFDPKFEFTQYARIQGVDVINDIEDIEREMKKLVEEMEIRVKSQISVKTLVIFDEFADAVANSRKGNELKNYEDVVYGHYKDGREKTRRECISVDKPLEENLRVLLQKGRSSGFRIIAATQRASTKVITGDAKVNFPVQICFRVPKDIDSIVVIDEPGAEALNGRGDGLIKSPEYLSVTRFQAFYKE
ncbi:MAG: DUF87 domain-containing protein [Paludibacter sp.]|nr:DUF87 domain-containing protein [Paludibacter sp.]